MTFLPFSRTDTSTKLFLFFKLATIQRSYSIGQNFVVKTLGVILSQQRIWPGDLSCGRAPSNLTNQCTGHTTARLTNWTRIKRKLPRHASSLFSSLFTLLKMLDPAKPDININKNAKR